MKKGVFISSQVQTFGTEMSPPTPPLAFLPAASVPPSPPAASAPPSLPAASAPQHTAFPSLYVVFQALALQVPFLAQNAVLLLPGHSIPSDVSSLLPCPASVLPAHFLHLLLAPQEYLLQGLPPSWTQMEPVQRQRACLRLERSAPVAKKINVFRGESSGVCLFFWLVGFVLFLNG